MDHDLINATDLVQWADRKDAEALLPELVKRLVYSSIIPENLQKISFPSREGVNSGGWDGETNSKSSHTYVPTGIAGWEMGKNKGKKDKADSDYATRTTGVPAQERADTTFVFVTPRRWPSKGDWVKEKKAENSWKEVIVWDAEDLITWLEQHVAVHHWITSVVKGPAAGIVSGESFWDRWANATKPVVAPTLLLSGRKKEAEGLAAELSAKPFSKVVHASSIEEATAFILCTIMALPEKLRGPLLSRTLVIETEYAFNRLLDNRGPLILIPTFNQPNVAGALEKGHSVLMPAGPASTTGKNALALPRLNVNEAVEVLKASGLDHNLAYKLAQLARRSPLAFRREIAIHPETLTSGWMNGERGADLVPALLLGSWNETNEQDKKIVEELVGTDYAQYERQLMGWATQEDAPLVKNDSVWRIVSERDACEVIARYITSDQRASFQKLALKILGTEDPSFDLPVDERWMANVKGYVAPYSSQVKRAVANSIALLAAYRGETKPAAGQATFQQIADYVVEGLLKEANADQTGKKWYSLHGILTLLAEASPEKFLDAVEKGLQGDNPILEKMFIEDDGFFTTSPHTNLLFALEVISWNKSYLSRVVLALSRLAEIDPGGKTANRPFSSLLDILSLIRPQTTATAQERLQLIDLVCARHAEIGRRLLIALIPESHSVHFGNAEPKFRDWKPDVLPSITYSEIYQMISEVVTRLLKPAQASGGEKWKELLERLTDLPVEDFEKVVSALSTVAETGLEEEDKTIIWHEIRSIISRHREFPDAKWSYPPEQLDKLEDIYNALTPSSNTALYSWLFSQSYKVALIRPVGHDWHENEKLAQKLRQEAAEKIYSEEGFSGVLEFSHYTERPHTLGYALPVLSKEDELALLDTMSKDDEDAKEVARGYIAKQVFTEGHTWALARLKGRGDWAAKARADFLLAIPANKELWLEVESLGEEVEKAYWQEVSPYGLGSDFGGYGYAARKYLAADRPYEALAALTYAKDSEKVDPQAIIDALTNATKINPKDSHVDIQMLGHYIGELLKVLAKTDDVDIEAVAGIEMTWFPLLREERDGLPLQIHKKLANEPEFFVELITLMYKARSKPKRAPTKLRRQRAMLASDLLKSWHVLPGTDEGRKVDYEKLKSWVTKAIELLKKEDRSSPGEYHIGELLYHSPASQDEKWPSDEVCRLLEEVVSERIEDGLSTEAYNSQGFVSKEEDDGRQRAESLEKRASEIDFTLPRAAKILRRVAANLRSRSQHLFRDDDEI